MDTLLQEISDYELANSIQLSEQDKKEIQNIYIVMDCLRNNKILLENIKDDSIIIFDKKLIFLQSEIESMSVSRKTDLQFWGMKNCTIMIKEKISHLSFHSCEDIDVKLMEGVISSVDFFHCDSVKLLVNNEGVRSIEFGDSIDVEITIPRSINKTEITGVRTPSIKCKYGESDYILNKSFWSPSGRYKVRKGFIFNSNKI